MSAIAEQMAATLGVYREQVDDAVLQCSHTYTDGGTTRTQTFNATRGSISAQQRLAITGSATTEVFSITIDTDELDTVHPVEGDRIKVRFGDDAEKEHTVITRNEDPTKATLTLIVGPKHG